MKKEKIRILAIDPGPEQSATVIWDGNHIHDKGITNNNDLLRKFDNMKKIVGVDYLVIEGMQSMGMAVGKSVFTTCYWIGRYIQVNTDLNTRLIYRHEVKMALCNSMRAKDSNIRRALIDRFGEPGTMKNPGRLYGVKADIWSALALAVVLYDKLKFEANLK